MGWTAAVIVKDNFFSNFTANEVFFKKNFITF